MYALDAVMEDDLVLYQWQKYTADLIGTLTERFCRYTGADNCHIPLFSEIIEPESTIKDNRTGKEIVDGVLEWCLSD